VKSPFDPSFFMKGLFTNKGVQDQRAFQEYISSCRMELIRRLLRM